MRSRPLPLMAAVILLVLLSVTSFPFPWEFLFPGEEPPPDFILYSGIVLGIAGLVVAFGAWMLKPWSFWATIVVSVLNSLLSVPGLFMAPTVALRVAIAATAIVAALAIVLIALPSSRRALRVAPAPGSARP